MTKEKFMEKISPILSQAKFLNWNLSNKVFAIAKNLNDDELELFYEFFTKYKIVKVDEYQSLLFASLEILEKKIPKNTSCIYFQPIIDIKNPNKLKSGHFVHSLLDSLEFYQREFFKGKHIHLENELQKAKKSYIFVFLDDFIGSGEQSKAFIEAESKRLNIKPNQIYILCFDIMSVGANLLESKGYNLVYLNKLNKCITEDMISPLKEKYSKILDEMEERFSVPEEYKRGKGKCEGLISLKKTPNNTLPIFWYSNFSSKPIFPRGQKK